MAGARPGVGAGLDSLRGAARAAPGRGARTATPDGRGRDLVAPGPGHVNHDILVAGAGPARLALAPQGHDHRPAGPIPDPRPAAGPPPPPPTLPPRPPGAPPPARAPAAPPAPAPPPP